MNQQLRHKTPFVRLRHNHLFDQVKETFSLLTMGVPRWVAVRLAHLPGLNPVEGAWCWKGLV